MTLNAGARIGAYEVVALLGTGGMGEVYRARDTKLNRDVALKIVPSEWALDRERLARFEREARILAALNHPNIAHIHGFDDSTGTPALVMELVEGPTLADRIATGPIALDEAFAIAKQVADALETAHEQGIIHRDLKPANIKVRDDGTVKLLDFGLAKALETPASEANTFNATQSPTITTPAMMTGVGMILGTAAYMSPEQAKGRFADKRSDIWAFGCVLFEMLSGKRAFEGDDVSDTLANVLKSEPDWTALPANTPAAIRQLLQSCLEKNRSARVTGASALLYVFTHPFTNQHVPTTRWPRRALAAGGLALVTGFVIGAIAFGARNARGPIATPGVSRLIVPIEAGTRFITTGRELLALSPDGSHLVYAANNQLYLRPMDSLNAVPIRGTGDPGAPAGRNPFFSPDGKWVAFWQTGKLKKVLVDGGIPVEICDAVNPFGASWAADGTIFWGAGPEGIYRVSANGGEPSLVLTDPSGTVYGPQLMPDGRSVLFSVRSDNHTWNEADIVVQSLDGGQRDVVFRGGTDAHYLDTGHLVYVANGTLFAVPFDTRSRKMTGNPVPVVEHVAQAPVQTGAAHYVVSSSGTLAYVAGLFGRPVAEQSLFWLDRDGRETKINAPVGPYAYPRLSPDDSRIAATILTEYQKIWILDVPRRTLVPLTTNNTREIYPVWTADGRRVVFDADQKGIWSQIVDSGAPATRLFPPSGFQLPTSFAPDGRLAFTAGDGDRIDLLTVANAKAESLVARPGRAARNGEVSPDGTMLAYETNESGQWQIVVSSFPNVADWHRQVSTDGGNLPAWRRDGRELFYVAHGHLMAATVTSGAPASLGVPSTITDRPYSWTVAGVVGRWYDVSHASDRFLVMKQEEESPPTENEPSSIVVVQNWTEELKRRVPTR